MRGIGSVGGEVLEYADHLPHVGTSHETGTPPRGSTTEDDAGMLRHPHTLIDETNDEARRRFGGVRAVPAQALGDLVWKANRHRGAHDYIVARRRSRPMLAKVRLDMVNWDTESALAIMEWPFGFMS